MNNEFSKKAIMKYGEERSRINADSRIQYCQHQPYSYGKLGFYVTVSLKYFVENIEKSFADVLRQAIAINLFASIFSRLSNNFT